MDKDVPEFTLIDGEKNSIYNNRLFHLRILELVEDVISGSDSIVLCHIKDHDGNTFIAELEKEDHEIALGKSLEFFIENEEYEVCNKIKSVLSKINS